MTPTEMLLKLLEQSGYEVTNETDEEGFYIIRQKEGMNATDER